MYRNDWNAAIQRAEALESELEDARGQQQHDARRITELEAALEQSRRALEAMRARGGFDQPMPRYQPSNATTVLVLGILSLVLCALLGPVAWYYGNQELDRIQAGVVEPQHASTARAGRILGIIGTGFLIASFGFVLFVGSLIHL